jgi:hydrogenase maturation factor HypE
LGEVVVVADTANAASKTVKGSLEAIASKAAKSKTTRPGEVVLRLSGKGGGTFTVSADRRGKVQVAETADVAGQPLFEVIGDAEAVQAILDGKVDARKQFLAGGIRIRGDLQHASDLAVELGLLKYPL